MPSRIQRQWAEVVRSGYGVEGERSVALLTETRMRTQRAGLREWLAGRRRRQWR